ncbi:thioredoxin domain-containing protein [Ornithinimicrobium avium]|uniref:Thioredoxin domain-containing protein n=1 Tax=Ornithinimicrobium avium TaxID=2283195 RepID=A0A345NIS0_9MICO|nr:thioredoxin domain-containing protein [Ornithinimicrobium avium]AXH94928.1 thioredoxin domain-containing protein [Ornithinimicrobium avium]
MPNRLAASTSPYLQQHADNPVDWWEWGEEAFAEARRRDVPVLLSVGYAACHWCHVMAHESFEDEQVAAVVNDGYVAIKVDREERPDVDAVYMAATTAMTGQGGWPMTCLLTPAGEPFWAGTYLPRDVFVRLLVAAGRSWREDRRRVEQGGAEVVAALRGMGDGAARGAALTEDDLAAAAVALAGDYDHQWGGFGGAPKFPPSMVLAFLQRHHGRTGDAHALAMVRGTCEAMARSGLYDQVGGGFARYAVDRRWVVPHFEKMLYDNALLLGVYADLARLDETSRPWAERVVRETVEWLLREMWTEQAAFTSSLDADTQGVEGLTYVWTPEQLRQVLGEEDGARAAELLAVTEVGTFEHGASTLQLRQDPDDPAWWRGVRERLDLHRSLRPQPTRDDKVVTAWNGLLISALAHAGWVLDEPEWVDLAARCARFLLDVHVVDGRLRRSSRDGTVGTALGVAEDYGDLADGLLALHRATGEETWLSEAGLLLDRAVDLFGEPDGTFRATGSDAERLVLTPRSEGDNAEPGGASSLALALVRHGAQAAHAGHLDAAGVALEGMASLARQAPRFAGWALTAAEELAAGPVVVRLSPRGATGPGQEAEGDLEESARHTSPGTLVVDGDPGTPDVGGVRAAVVCRGTVCDLPVTRGADLPQQVLGSVGDRP